MLPASLRWANTFAVVIGMQIAVASIIDFRVALNIDDPELFSGDETHFSALQPSAAGQREILLAQRSGMQSAITSIRPWRLATEALLAVSGIAVFVLGLRIRTATEGRAELAVMLGRAAIAAAALRTIDGAQNLVITRSVANFGKDVFSKSPPTLPDGVTLEHLTLIMQVPAVGSVGLSFFVVSVFMGLATYFGSERLRDALQKAEP